MNRSMNRSMNMAKKIGKFYGYGILYSGALVLCYDNMHNRHLPFKEKCWIIADDMSKCLYWPINAPGAIKRFFERLD